MLQRFRCQTSQRSSLGCTESIELWYGAAEIGVWLALENDHEIFPVLDSEIALSLRSYCSGQRTHVTLILLSSCSQLRVFA